MNAKQEFLNAIDGKPNVKCASVDNAKLKENYSIEDLNKFLEDLDFNYHDGYGCQELDGTVWFVDGSWLERGEYDGSEWWDYKNTPEIPKELK